MEERLRRTAVVQDPHPLWRDALREVLGRVDVDVVATATSGRQAAGLVARIQPDLLVTSCGALIAELGRREGLRAILLADSAAPAAVEAAFRAGASAYVLRTAHPDDVATAVRQTFAQTVYTGSRLPRSTPATPAGSSVITRREREILVLVAEGRSNGEVAQLLWITRQTVKFHLASVYRKLGVGNRTEAARWAHEHGLLDRPEPALAA